MKAGGNNAKFGAVFRCSSKEWGMSKVLLIGAGGVGGVVAHKCSQAPEVFSSLVLASRTLSKCDHIKSQILKRRPGYKIETAQVDADKTQEVVALIKRV